jgi:hypothetical protein
MRDREERRVRREHEISESAKAEQVFMDCLLPPPLPLIFLVVSSDGFWRVTFCMQKLLLQRQELAKVKLQVRPFIDLHGKIYCPEVGR